VQSNHRIILTVLLTSVLLEALASESLKTVPLDVGYTPDTSEWLKLLGWPGIIIHFPAFLFFRGTEPWLAYLAVGYLDSVIVVSTGVLVWPIVRAIVSTNQSCPPKPERQ
jgi:hypothetical protein